MGRVMARYRRWRKDRRTRRMFRQWQAGRITVNQARAMIDLPPIGEVGDYTRPASPTFPRSIP